jgi:hypothetical protein
MSYDIIYLSNEFNVEVFLIIEREMSARFLHQPCFCFSFVHCCPVSITQYYSVLLSIIQDFSGLFSIFQHYSEMRVERCVRPSFHQLWLMFRLLIITVDVIMIILPVS